VIERMHAHPAKEMVNEIFNAVQQFCGDAPQSDDRTVVVVKIDQLGPVKPVAGSQ
jgi:serine phosphatase RsbU (regulator of sigma subunit)